jgi:acyl carrier protein
MTEKTAPVDNKVRDIVSALFNLPQNMIAPSTSHEDTDAWDSVGHLNLILALQEEFSLTIEPEDFEELNSVGAIIDYVINSTNKQKRP